MHSLALIAVLALLTLLWAGASATRHIRRARRRQRRLAGSGRDAETASPAEIELEFRDGSAVSRAHSIPFASPSLPQKAVAVVPVEDPFAPQEISAEEADPILTSTVIADETQTDSPAREIDMQPDAMGSPQISDTLAVAEAETVIEEKEVDAVQDVTAATEHVPQVPIVALADKANPAPSPRSSRPVPRVDWSFFNKDMGDLTDPYEHPRRLPIRPAPHASPTQKEVA